MRIRHLSINNFRGIRELEWALPDKNLFCLIGRGDSTKSTILEAVRRVFHPQWNLSFDDADFHNCAPAQAIKIEVVLGAITDEFRDLGNYGHWLCGWNVLEQRRAEDPGEGLEDALRIRLLVKDDLEPSWCVIKHDDDDGIPFKANDRAKVSVSFIGAISDRHLTWSRGSILSELTETGNISSSLAEAARAAKAALEARRGDHLTRFDQVAQRAEATARSLGVSVNARYKAHLDTDAINVRLAGLSLHDGEMPLRQLGLGSKRMLTTGLQKQALRAPHVTLFDEVEIGLEPHRIARLIQHLKEDTTGQYFLTTHSPVVLRELTIADLHIARRKDGNTEIVAADKAGLADSLQGKIRAGAEAFLAPKVIVCEGATEVGFLRGLDDYWISKQEKAFAYLGVALYDANGASKIREIADDLKALSYDVAVLADSDDQQNFSLEHARELLGRDIAVTRWEGDVSIEQRVLADLPWAGVMASFEAARKIGGDDERLLDQVQTHYGKGFSRDFRNWVETPALREALGKAATASDWFKRQSWGHEWATTIAPFLSDATIRESALLRQLTALRGWIDRA
jgi:putative ATP-dependent endonuclease of the OLD family